MSYSPKPMDTSAVTVPVSLQPLLEAIAKNTHEVWAAERMAQGWIFGSKRDDGLKQHPCLIPYEDLPEAEKEYDRKTATEVIKMILGMGYQVVTPQGVVASNPLTSQLLRLLNDEDTILAELVDLYHRRETIPELIQGPLVVYEKLAERLQKEGMAYPAIEIAGMGLEHFPGDPSLRRIKGLAWARSGASEQANRLLQELVDEGYQDSETLGILARTHKDLGLLASDPTERARHWERSFHWYELAFLRNDKNYYVGINAATLATLRMDQIRAKSLADQVVNLAKATCEDDPATRKDPYWALATLGEASLLLNQLEEAKSWYSKAIGFCKNRWGDVSSTRRQARIILRELGHPSNLLDGVLKIPKVVLFTGHMIDQPGRAHSRFPPTQENQVKNALKMALTELGGAIGFSSAAFGSDILFQEALKEIKGERHIVLPFAEKPFISESVDVLPTGNWVERFYGVLEKATEVITISSEKMAAGSISYEYANAVLIGLATLRARELDTDLVCLAVWDGKIGDGKGGTCSVVDHWSRLGLETHCIRLDEGMLVSEKLMAVTVDDIPQDPNSEVAKSDVSVKGILFGDAVGFSKLTEEQVPRFVQHFLSAISDVLAQSHNRTLVQNTWGDGLYLVFDNIAAAGRVALDIRDKIRATDWQRVGLPKNLSLRIALHAGPVYFCTDPVTGKKNCVGTHISRAARIEPITAPGEVYASQAFAALAASERVADFSCEFMQTKQLAKKYGVLPTYIVHRRKGRI